MSEHQQSVPQGTARCARLVLWLALAALVLSGLAFAWLYSYATTPGPALDTETVTVFIPRGMPTAEIIAKLEAAQLIDVDLRLFILMKFYEEELNLQAGEFALHTGQYPIKLLKELTTARPVEYQLTIPEGYTIAETAALFARHGWADQQRFIELCTDPVFINSLNLAAMDSLEGYLFPDTYRLKKPPIREERLIKMLVNRSTEIYQQLIEQEQEEISALTRQEIYTLASIVEKESGQDAERAIIASVFFNRLKKNMRLQSDPTVYFGLGLPKRKLTRKDLADPSPYNTYLIWGLPPGPICSPGAASLIAVLNPAVTGYYYFVSKNDGSHHFSTNLLEHNRAVRKYQR